MAQATLTRPPTVPLLPTDSSLLRFVNTLNRVLRGGISATMGVTLVPNETSSSFSDTRIGRYTYVGLMPASAHAVDILPSIWIEPTAGGVTIHHPLVPYDDLVFVACLLG